MANAINVVGLGPILLDSFSRGSVKVDRKVEISNLEEVNFHPLEGEPISTPEEILIEPGGPTFWAVNTIRSLSDGEINPKMIATIGGNPSDPLKSGIAKVGTDESNLIEIPDQYSAASLVTIDKIDPKKREVKWTPSPAKLQPKDIEVRKDSVFPTSMLTILHIDCREEFASPIAVEIVRAQSSDSFVYMDTGDLKDHTLDLIEKTRPDGIQMPKRCAVAICQQNGINQISSLEELVNGVRQVIGIKDNWLQFLVVTDGEHGSAYCFKESQAEDFKTGSQPAYQVTTVDSNGAGDIFAGGISYARKIMGRSWDDSVKFASATAAIKCEKLGRSGNIPAEGLVIEFQKQH